MIARFRRKYTAKETALGFAFMAPALALFGVFSFLPFWRILSWGTFESRQGGTHYEQVGLDQYRDVLTSDSFKDGVWHSTLYVLFTLPVGLAMGVLLAVAAHRRLRGIKIFQTVFSSTIASSAAVASVVFYFLLNPVIGVFEVDWLQNPDMALFAVSLTSMWRNLGVSFVIVLAGLQAIPEEVHEAATLDGYGPVRRLFRITLPLLSPTLMFLLVVLTVGGFQAFAEVEVLTQGGPGQATEVLVYKIFEASSADRITVGSVMSVGLFVITGLVAFLQFTLLDRRVHYGVD
jgi:sn-glycerol 3-phosphate transport system permease protein